MSRDRILSSAIMIALSIGAVLDKWVMMAVLLSLTIGGLYEFFHLVKKKGIPIYSYTGIIIGVILPALIFARFELTKNWELLFIVLILLWVVLMQLARKDNTNAIVGISTTLFGVLYVSWLFSFLIKIRYLLPGMEGAKLLGFILLVTKCGDMGALIFGKQFGKHPLLPRVSPNKTVEGSLGGLFASAFAAALSINLLPAELNYSVFQVVLMGLCIGSVGQIGDMSESLIKRDCNVKDSGKMLPALGGALDAIDSLLFSAPTFYFFMSVALGKG